MRRFINKIIDRIQRKRAIKNHRKMWHWLAENPREWKCDYFQKRGKRYKEPSINGCYLCTYAARGAMDVFTICSFCPLDWGGRECIGKDSLFSEWMDEHFMLRPNEQRMAEIALQIAELPEKVEK